MSISSARYTTADKSLLAVTVNGVTSFVPLDPANADYQNIMALVAAGELTIAPAEPEP